LHIVYAIVITLGFLGLSKCSEAQPYPWAFVLGDVVFFVTYALCSQFNMKEVEKCKPETGAKEEKEHDLTVAQFKAFFGKYKQMAMWHGLELLLGRVLFKTLFDGALICGGNGTEWHYRSGVAHLFLVLHIMGTVQALGTQSEILVKTVKGKKAVASLDKKDN